MKKWISLLLVLALCCSLFVGCGEEKTEGKLSVGFGKVNVTPAYSLPLDGYEGKDQAQFRWSNSTDYPLYALCTAITDEKGATVMVVTLDLLNAFMADAMREAIAGHTDVPKENIIFHCTHNHSGIALRVADPIVTQYIGELTDMVVQSAKQALEDRKIVVSMETAFTRVDGCTYVRHYLLTDGQYVEVTRAVLPQGETWYSHATIADNMLQLVKFTREGGKDVVLANFQSHPCAKIDKLMISSDYPGVMRENLESSLDCHAVFIQGGAGNLGSSSQVAEVKKEFDLDYKQRGKLLADKAVEALKTSQPMDPTALFIQEKELTVQTEDGGAQKVYLIGFSVGDFAMVTAPFEIFDTNAMKVKEESPYKMTFYASCTNGSNGYLPTPASFSYQQQYEGMITKYVMGTAETVQDTQLQMLSELFAQTGRTQSEKPEGYVRSEFVPQSDGIEYQAFVASTDDFKPVTNSFYSFAAVAENKLVVLLIKDLQVAEKIIARPAGKLIFDHQKVVVDIAD